MSSLMTRLLVSHRMLTRELVPERRKPKPSLSRIAKLRAERLRIKLKIARHLPRSGSLLKIARGVMRQLVGGTTYSAR